MMNKNDTSITAVKVTSFLQWARIYWLYHTTFPSNEKKPFSIIVSMSRAGKTDTWYFERDRRFIGFASTINSSDLIMLDYLVITPGRRGKGYGTQMLQALRTHYKGKGVFVEIESIYEDAPNVEERKRRKQFYVSNEMQPMQVMANVFGTNMELLGWDCRLTFDDYQTFYRNYYSARAADHLFEVEHPEAKKHGDE